MCKRIRPALAGGLNSGFLKAVRLKDTQVPAKGLGQRRARWLDLTQEDLAPKIETLKTDLRVDMSEEAYRRQVALYQRALEAATNSPTKGVLLFV